ncbi:alpha/beta fold hydrolase [Actinacidiphila glaucinigra]|uniref:alpha/beta fold hydrolase n=1 Tax=Actinacidiphila glaucinigra TaxID=235986 RepID=UPI003D8FF56A
MRALVGDDRLHYLGFSYGTYLGATYAGLFPSRVGRMVLDGAGDPTTRRSRMTAVSWIPHTATRWPGRPSPPTAPPAPAARSAAPPRRRAGSWTPWWPVSTGTRGGRARTSPSRGTICSASS